jgi:hypothetical protein
MVTDWNPHQSMPLSVGFVPAMLIDDGGRWNSAPINPSSCEVYATNVD